MDPLATLIYIVEHCQFDNTAFDGAFADVDMVALAERIAAYQGWRARGGPMAPRAGGQDAGDRRDKDECNDVGHRRSFRPFPSAPLPPLRPPPCTYPLTILNFRMEQF